MKHVIIGVKYTLHVHIKRINVITAATTTDWMLCTKDTAQNNPTYSSQSYFKLLSC